MLLLPISLMEFWQSPPATFRSIFVSIIFFYSKKSVVDIIIPKDADLGFIGFKEPSHQRYHALMILMIGLNNIWFHIYKK